MATSVVYWRFKAMREPLTVSFEGTGISVWDLKKEIIASQNMVRVRALDVLLVLPATAPWRRGLPRADTSRLTPRAGQGRRL